MHPANKVLLAALTGGTLVAAVSQYEGTEYTPYKDVNNVWTVCQGHTGRDVTPGRVYGSTECNAILRADLVKHGKGVLACVKVPLNRNQFEAFTSFAYNAGVASFCGSTMARKLNAGDYTGACNELMRWTYAGGKWVRGLEVRRAAERKLCLTPMEQTA